MDINTFKKFVFLKEEGNNDWKHESLGPPLAKGFIPPTSMRPIIDAFSNSSKIGLMDDTSKEVTMPAKQLYLSGGSVRDFIKGKSITEYHLSTNATPTQIAIILSSAGFKAANKEDVESLHLPRTIKNHQGKKVHVHDDEYINNDNQVWHTGKRDSEKPISINVRVDDNEFEIITFNKNNKGGVDKKVEFVDNPKEDSKNRDLTINCLYIELNKSDGENKKLFDPTRTGLHDLEQGKVKAIGKAEERMGESPIRSMRALRFHCRFGKGGLDDDLAKSIPSSLSNVDPKEVRDEFVKGLMHPDVDPKCYLNLLRKTGLLKSIFPGASFDAPDGVPHEFSDQKDKPLALAWMLQHNPIEMVEKILGRARIDSSGVKETGWSDQERRAVIYLLKLKDFNDDSADDYLLGRAGTGLSKDQIRNWVDMFNVKDTKRNRRPWWAKKIRAFADAM